MKPDSGLTVGVKPRTPELRIRTNHEPCSGCGRDIVWREVYQVGSCPKKQHNRFKSCYLCAATEWENQNG